MTTGSGKLNNQTLLYDPLLVDAEDLRRVPDIEMIEVPKQERGPLNNANVIFFPTTGKVIVDVCFAATIRMLEGRGFSVIPLDGSEYRKIAGGPSCRSMRFNWHYC